MGFFFTQQKTEAKRSAPRKALRAAPQTKQNAATLNRLGCAACPLNKADVHTPKMQPTIAATGGIYFLAEAPGRHEDETSGRPLTGPSGKLLRECIPDGEERYCSFDNTVHDRPPNNRTPTWTEMECCRGRVIANIEKAKPKLVVGLGGVPLIWALGSTDLSGMRGRLFAVRVGNHSFWFYPTYHPSFILHVARDKSNPLRSKHGHCFKMDIKRAFALLDSLPPAEVEPEKAIRAGVQGFDGSGGHDALLRLLKRAKQAPFKAVDLETYPLRPFAANAAIMTAAISFDDVNFSFAIDHPKSGWSKDQRKTILNELNGILKDDTKKIAHNVPFEVEWFLEYFGAGVVNHHAWECTMMQAHFLDERRGKQAYGNDDDSRRAVYQALDFLCKQHFGVAYKSMFKLDKKDMRNADLTETLIYNAVDTKYTLRLWNRQRALLKEGGLLAAYREALPRQPTVALMQYFGIDVDQVEVKVIQQELSGEIKVISDQIATMKVVQKYKADKGEFNPLSSPDTISIFRDYLKRPEVAVDKATVLDFDNSSASKKKVHDGDNGTKYSTDKKVLEQIDHPLADAIIKLRNLTKNKSTYADCFEYPVGSCIWHDKKIHTSFNTTFAETGRTSSDVPNMQNFPKRKDAWVRKQIIAPPKHILVAADYGQLEGCTAAMCSKDKVLVQALWDNYDLHMEWAQRLVKRHPMWIDGSEDFNDKATAKKYRSIAKNKLVFPAIFGANTNSIAGYLKIPEDVAEDIMTDFWRMFTGLKSWQDRLMKIYYDTGWVESPTGRLHRYPLTRNQVINFPVQGVAADIVCDSMNTLSEYAVKNGDWAVHPRLNIHDDLTFVVPDSKADVHKAIETIYRVMLTPPYDFINVPMSVEVSTGYNWFEMKEVGKFWSNKDL